MVLVFDLSCSSAEGLQQAQIHEVFKTDSGATASPTQEGEGDPERDLALRVCYQSRGPRGANQNNAGNLEMTSPASAPRGVVKTQETAP